MGVEQAITERLDTIEALVRQLDSQRVNPQAVHTALDDIADVHTMASQMPDLQRTTQQRLVDVERAVRDLASEIRLLSSLFPEDVLQQAQREKRQRERERAA